MSATTRIKGLAVGAAAALGITLGAAAVAGAATNPSPQPTDPPVSSVSPSNQDGAPEVNEQPDADEAPEQAGTPEDDGVDHEFEGHEVGNNGDGVPDADDAAEATQG